LVEDVSTMVAGVAETAPAKPSTNTAAPMIPQRDIRYASTIIRKKSRKSRYRLLDRRDLAPIHIAPPDAAKTNPTALGKSNRLLLAARFATPFSGISVFTPPLIRSRTGSREGLKDDRFEQPVLTHSTGTRLCIVATAQIAGIEYRRP
jgi:hypothetical protein